MNKDQFNEWWDADQLTQTNPYREDSPAYWAWEGWQASQTHSAAKLNLTRAEGISGALARRGKKMTPLEMAANAARALAESGTVGVVMTIAEGGMPRGFPRGELLNEMERDGIVERTYHFNPEKVIAWLIRNGLIEMERTNDTTISFKVPNVK